MEDNLKGCNKAGISIPAKENGGSGGKIISEENIVKNVPKLRK